MGMRFDGALLLQMLFIAPECVPTRTCAIIARFFTKPQDAAFGGFYRAYDSPARVVELADLGGLALPIDGRIDPTQVGVRCRRRHARHHLRDARLRGVASLNPPVAGREGILEGARDLLVIDQLETVLNSSFRASASRMSCVLSDLSCVR